jgi:hypothetical protein
MKTPREILTERHRHMGPELDGIRQKVITAMPSLGSVDAGHRRWSEDRSIGAALTKVWQQLIWPSRRAWAGMAVIWLAVLGANIAMNGASRGTPSRAATSSRDIAQALHEQQRLLAELLPTEAPPIRAARPKPGPRSQRPTIFKHVEP